MMMQRDGADRERVILGLLSARLKDDGYEVFIPPRAPALPRFLESVQPALISTWADPFSP